MFHPKISPKINVIVAMFFFHILAAIFEIEVSFNYVQWLLGYSFAKAMVKCWYKHFTIALAALSL
jgi:ABC-type transport system involved in Fe-S cluster assembly fused permease/ATPase subunit